MKKIITCVLLLVSILIPGLILASQPIAIDPIGTNIVDDSGTVFLLTTENGQTVRRPYTSGGAFLSYGFNSFDKLSKNAYGFTYPVGTFIPPQDGKIICSDRGGDKGTCYLISQSAKIGFPTAQIFLGQGFSFTKALYGDTSFLSYPSNVSDINQAHAPGVLINNGGTIYLVGNNGLLGIPSVQTFQSWGYSFADVVSANSSDKQLGIIGNMTSHQAGQLSPLAGSSSTVPPSPNPSPVPSPAPQPIIYYNPTPAPNYHFETNSSTPPGGVAISVDASTPATAKINMGQNVVPLYAINFAETSGNEAVNLKGFIITATVTGGVTVGANPPNTGYDTLKNFSLVSGSTVITRPGWASLVRREGSGPQTYTIDFLTGLPLNFQISSSSNISLKLVGDVNTLKNNASANSNWTFTISSPLDVSLVGVNTGASIAPVINNGATSNILTIIKQPIAFTSVSSISGSNFATAQSAGSANSQEVVGIFTASNPSTEMDLTNITLAQSGSALPTGTSSVVSYYVYDASQSSGAPVGIATMSGGISVVVNLNLNSALNKGLIIPENGSVSLVIKADTSNFNTCLSLSACSAYGYGLTLSAWQWVDPKVPGSSFVGPFASDTIKTAVYQGSYSTRIY